MLALQGVRISKRFLSTWGLADTFDKYLIGSEPVVKDQHSKLIAKRGLVYNVEIQDVKPGYVSDYLRNAKAVLPAIHDSEHIPVQLYGQFHVQLGQLDRVYTIWRYAGGYADVDTTLQQLSELPDYAEFEQAQGKLLQKREQQICYEFSFWPQYNDDWDGGLFEIRSYSLKAGCLYEWANAWSTAILLREKEAVMGLCSQIGGMYTVHHIWRYSDLEHRRSEREKAWQFGQWGDVVVRTVPMIKDLTVNIMKATDYSPLR